MSGVSALRLQEVLLMSAWISGFLKWTFMEAGMELVSGRLNWAIDHDGECLLADPMNFEGMDLRKNGATVLGQPDPTSWFESGLDAFVTEKTGNA